MLKEFSLFKGNNAFFIKSENDEKREQCILLLHEIIGANEITKVVDLGNNLLMITNFPKYGCGDIKRVLDEILVKLKFDEIIELNETTNNREKLFTEYGFIIKVNDKIYNEVSTLLEGVRGLTEPAKFTVSDCKYIVEIYNSTLTKGTRISDGNLQLNKLVLVDEFKKGFNHELVQKLYDAYKMLRYITKKVDKRLFEDV